MTRGYRRPRLEFTPGRTTRGESELSHPRRYRFRDWYPQLPLAGCAASVHSWTCTLEQPPRGVHRDDQSQRDSAAMGISNLSRAGSAWFGGGGHFRSGMEGELMSSMQRERSLALRILK